MSRTAATTDVFTAIAEPHRRRIIELLARRRQLAVTAIVLALGVRQPSVSKHLAVLRRSGVVTVVRQGQSRLYQLNYEKLRAVYDWAKSFEQHWSRQLDRIKARAEARAGAADSTNPSPDKKGTSP